MSKVQTAKDAKILYRVTTVEKSWISTGGVPNPDIVKEQILDQRTLNYYKTCPSAFPKIMTEEELGPLWPEGVEVRVTNSSYRNCLSRTTFQVTSPKPLTEEDLEILRAQGAFGYGQAQGGCDLDQVTQVDGLYCYTAATVCDSGD